MPSFSRSRARRRSSGSAGGRGTTPEYLARFGPWGLAAQTVLFGGLLLAARRSRAAWDVVTDPLWGKVGIQFWTLLRFWPALQRWALARWRDALGKEYPAEDYLPMPLAGPQGAAMVSSELAGALAPGRRIWLQGAAGMGKTALVDHAVADWCAEPGDLGAAFARWGYVPLPIALRDFAAVPVPTAPEEWLFDLAGRRLEAAGLRVEDARLLRGMLTAGYWVLLLDGANEVDDKGAIQQFARRFPQVGMLVTSQAEPRAEAAGLFEVWRLPPDIRAATGPLLELYLGPERGAEVLRRIEAAPIADDIRSGYDVRLVADLVAGGTDPWALPATRVDLYDAMLRAAGDGYPVADLCRVAWGCLGGGAARPEARGQHPGRAARAAEAAGGAGGAHPGRRDLAVPPRPDARLPGGALGGGGGGVAGRPLRGDAGDLAARQERAAGGVGVLRPAARRGREPPGARLGGRGGRARRAAGGAAARLAQPGSQLEAAQTWLGRHGGALTDWWAFAQLRAPPGT